MNFEINNNIVRGNIASDASYLNLRKNDCKIAVIGSGNAGIISALMIIFSYRYNGLSDPHITIFHDSKVPTEIVGQGTTINVSHAISRLISDEHLGNLAGITPKVGFLYKDWAKKNKNLLYKLGGNAMSYHYDPAKLRECFLKTNLTKLVEKSVTPEEIKNDFDFIIDCRGKTVNNWEEYEEMVSPVNCCLIARTFGPRPPEVWTENIATKDGWTFKIPLEDGYSYGYVFNENITNSEVAESNFYEMFGVETLHKVPFRNYLSKKYFDEENKTLLNGNRLFFYDPLESSATPMYGTLITDFFFNALSLKKNKIHQTLDNYDTKVREVHQWILWHYSYGSHYNTEFWRYAQDLAENYNYSKSFRNLVDTVKMCDWERFIGQHTFPNTMIYEFDFNDYAFWYFNNVG